MGLPTFLDDIKVHRKILPHYSMAGVMTRDGNNGTITLTEQNIGNKYAGINIDGTDKLGETCSFKQLMFVLQRDWIQC